MLKIEILSYLKKKKWHRYLLGYDNFENITTLYFTKTKITVHAFFANQCNNATPNAQI